jgi:phage regulator Rha-like protein
MESIGASLLSFESVEIIGKNAIGGLTKQKHYIMDRDAFSMLVFGFNGPKAMVFKSAGSLR